MLHAYNLAVRRLGAFVNALVTLLVMVTIFVAVNRDNMPSGPAEFLAMRITMKNLLLAGICITGSAWAFQVFGLTKPLLTASWTDEVVRVTKACTVAAAFATLFPLTSQSGSFRLTYFLAFMPTTIAACLFGRFLARLIVERFARRLSGIRTVVIVGSGSRALALYEQIRASRHCCFEILGFVTSPTCNEVSQEIRHLVIGSVADLEGVLMRQAVDEVLITLPAESSHAEIQFTITTCERAGVEARYHLSDIFALSVAKPAVEPEGTSPVVRLKVVQDDARMLVKRAIDVAGALSALILLAPLLLLVAAAIRITSPGPAIFVQERYGLRKRRFRMYKFRTMVRDAEALQAGLESLNEAKGPAFKIRKDPRVTPLGWVLRKTSLDELPQLFNVLRGEMSLVGPRPLPARDVSRFERATLMRRFSVKPGLTCLWQVNGRSDTDFERWINLDLQYIDQWSLGLDLKILCQTVPTVLSGRGAV
jgi:exopolysaccharide biosynthesis polyprenyl glycosylphosphotransferase